MTETTSNDSASPPIFVSGKALFAILVWGASFVITRIALESLHPFTIVVARLLIGLTLLFALTRFHKQRLLPDRKDIPICLVLGGILSVHLLIQAYGLLKTSAISSGWIIGFIPVPIAITSHFLGRQHISRLGWIGTAIGACGILLVTLTAPPDFSQARLGDFLQLTSCFTWTAYTVLGGEPVRRNGALSVSVLAMSVAALILLPFMLTSSITVAPLSSRSIAAVLFLGLCCSGLAFYWWYEAVAKFGPARVGALIYFQPFVTLATSVYFKKDEIITWNALAGGACVLVGVWLISRGTSRR